MPAKKKAPKRAAAVPKPESKTAAVPSDPGSGSGTRDRGEEEFIAILHALLRVGPTEGGFFAGWAYMVNGLCNLWETVRGGSIELDEVTDPLRDAAEDYKTELKKYWQREERKDDVEAATQTERKHTTSTATDAPPTPIPPKRTDAGTAIQIHTVTRLLAKRLSDHFTTRLYEVTGSGVRCAR